MGDKARHYYRGNGCKILLTEDFSVLSALDVQVVIVGE